MNGSTDISAKCRRQYIHNRNKRRNKTRRRQQTGLKIFGHYIIKFNFRNLQGSLTQPGCWVSTRYTWTHWIIDLSHPCMIAADRCPWSPASQTPHLHRDMSYSPSGRKSGTQALGTFSTSVPAIRKLPDLSLGASSIVGPNIFTAHAPPLRLHGLAFERLVWHLFPRGFGSTRWGKILPTEWIGTTRLIRSRGLNPSILICSILRSRVHFLQFFVIYLNFLEVADMKF